MIVVFSSSPVFCQGSLLEAVQNASIFRDSKEFVDRPLTQSPDAVLEAFGNLSDPRNATVLRQFVEQWTLDAGSDLEMWEPPDWVERSDNTPRSERSDNTPSIISRPFLLICYVRVSD